MVPEYNIGRPPPPARAGTLQIHYISVMIRHRPGTPACAR